MTLKYARKGCLVISLDYCASHPWHFCAVGDDSCLEIWCPSAILQGYVEEPTAKKFVARKACTIALSKAGGTQQSTLFTSLEIPWGFPTQAVLHSLAGLMSRKKVLVWGFLWVRKVWFAFAQWTFAPNTFGKRRKGERSMGVSLLQGSASTLLQETHTFCARNMEANVWRTISECQRYKKTGQEIEFLCSQQKRKVISKLQFCKNTRIRS